MKFSLFRQLTIYPSWRKIIQWSFFKNHYQLRKMWVFVLSFQKNLADFHIKIPKIVRSAYFLNPSKNQWDPSIFQYSLVRTNHRASCHNFTENYWKSSCRRIKCENWLIQEKITKFFNLKKKWFELDKSLFPTAGTLELKSKTF